MPRALLPMLLLVLAACDTAGPAFVRVSIDQPPGDSLVVSQGRLFTATVVDQDGRVVNTPVTWTVSDTSLASVAGDGTMTGRRVGNVALQARAGNHLHAIVIHIIPRIHTIQILGVDGAEPLQVQLRPAAAFYDEHGTAIEGRVPDWQTLTPTVLRVDSPGVFMPVQLGEARLRLAVDDTTLDLAFQVLRPASSVRVSAPVFTFKPHDTVQLQAVVYNVLGQVAPYPVTWSTPDPGALTVSATGLVIIGPRLGSARVRARVDNLQDTIVLPVTYEFVAIEPAVGGMCALARGGQVACSGENDQGQIGAGPTIPLAPQTFVKLDTRDSIIGLASGLRGHRCALRTDGTALCWGPLPSGMARSPVAFTGPEPLTWLSLGENYMTGLSASGQLYWWGMNAFFGGSAGFSPDPVTATATGTLRFREVHSGVNAICGLGLDSLVYCWGNGSTGLMGDGTTAGHATPIAVPGLSGIVDLTLSYLTACAVDAAGAVYCWGADLGFPNGQRPADPCATGYRCALTPTRLLNIVPARSVAVGYANGCALDDAGVATCWGDYPTYRDTERIYTSISATNSFWICGVTSTRTYCPLAFPIDPGR